jgi:hypothetical protein
VTAGAVTLVTGGGADAVGAGGGGAGGASKNSAAPATASASPPPITTPRSAKGSEDFFTVWAAFETAAVMAGSEASALPARRVTLCTMLTASVREAGAPRASLNAVTEAKRSRGFLASALISARSACGGIPCTRREGHSGGVLMCACISS